MRGDGTSAEETRLHDTDQWTRLHSDQVGGSPPDESDRVPGYKTMYELGRGGFGTVYAATGRRGRKVAIKVLSRNLSGMPDVVRRFRAVGTAAKRLQHPNIVQVLDVTETEEGRPALVMELVEGRTLRDLLNERGHLSVSEAVSIAVKVCEALEYAHGQGVIHRDVKPGNIMITADGNIKLADFDIAKVFFTDQTLTRTGSVLGSYYYMAPEQLKGDKDIDGRADVFSVGVVLYEMLTGELPIGRFDSPSEVGEGIPWWLGEVVLKALSRRREARYSDIGKMKKALLSHPLAPDWGEGAEPVYTLKAHSGLVEGLAFSPDGKLLASGSWDETVRLWRLPKGKLRSVIQTDNVGWVHSVAFSPDSKILALGGRSGTIQLRRVRGLKLLRTLEGHTGAVYGVAFSPNGRTLLSGSQDGTVRLWRVVDGVQLRVFKGHDGGVNSVAFGPRGNLVASGSRDRTVRLWRASDGTTLNVLKGHTLGVQSVEFSPEGDILASASGDKTVRLWNVADGTLVLTLKAHTDWVRDVVFNHAGTILASASDDGTVRLWSAADAALVRMIKPEPSPVGNEVWKVAFSPDDKLLAAGLKDGRIQVWGRQGLLI